MYKDREAIFDALYSILIDKAYSNIAINHALKKHEVYSKKYVRNVVKGVLRYLLLLDYYIDSLSKKGIKSIKNRDLLLIRIGMYEILFLDGVPDYATVNQIVVMAKKKCKGREKFINGILRTFIRTKDEIKLPVGENAAISVIESFPIHLVEMFIKQYGKDNAIKIIKGLNETPQLTLRYNRLKTNREKLIDELEGLEPSEMTDLTIIAKNSEIISSEQYKKGMFSVQGEASVMAILSFDLEPNSKVLDMCAAPGGKTTCMAEIMNNVGSITACDIYEHRLRLVENECERLSIEIVDTKNMDGSVYDSNYEECFDYVLADVPCSGLGVIGKKPEIKYNCSIKEMKELPEIQYNILLNAGKYVKKNGYVMYSTCTLNKEENEKVVDRFLKNNNEFKVVEINTTLPYNGKVDGFFYCKIIKFR